MPKLLPSDAGKLAYQIAHGSPHARDRIRPYVQLTPTVESVGLTETLGTEVLLKCEHRQTTGSFKLRGALNRVLTLPRIRLDEGLIVASTGNHGAAVAYACRVVGGKCTVVVPKDVNPIKERSMRDLGAEVRKHGCDGLEAERFARQLAELNGLQYVSPYNDPDVITGQSTVGLELADRLEPHCSVYIAVGGGGLIAGVAAVLKSKIPSIRIVGCSPHSHPVMDESVRVGHIVDLPLKPTLSEGTAGGLEHDTITLPLCVSLVDDWIQVDEDEIADSIRYLARNESMIVEGAAAVAVAGMRKDTHVGDRKRVAILCGGNIDRAVLQRVLQG